MFLTRKNISKENMTLKENLAIASLELSRLKQFERENSRLRDALDFKKSKPFRSVAARVIGRSPSAWSRTIIIDRGTKNDIKKGMAVCTKEGLIGTIKEPGPFSSKVMLLTDPNSKIGVILADSRQAGVLEGSRGGMECIVKYLSMDEEINKGEPVYTSGYGGIYPKNIFVGNIIKVYTDTASFYKYATVKLAQNPNSIDEVICLK